MKNAAVVAFVLFLFIVVTTPANSHAANINPDTIDMKKMSKDTGIPVAEIKYRLGDKSIATVEDARAVFTLSLSEQLSPSEQIEERYRALEKWIELSATTKEIREAWKRTNKGSGLYDKALQRWIDIAKTPTEAREVWELSPINSKEKKAAFEKLASFYKK